MGRNGAVSSGHPLASLSGIRVLQEGGNAIDAALATAFTMTVVKPDASGLGGDLFALVFSRDKGKVEALNASGPAPKKATIEFFQGKGLEMIPNSGPLSIAVPGAVDGWLELHRRYGSLDLARLVADAVSYARQGFAIHAELAERITEVSPSFPGVDRCFRRPLGADVKAGGRLCQEGLAVALEQIAKKGREGFYGGELGQEMCRAIQAEGGIIAPDDLEEKFAEWLAPLRTTYRGYEILEQPPVSQGFMVLEMLNIFEAFPGQESGMDQAEKIHFMIGAKKLAFEDRIHHLEDPRFGDPKIELLISKEHAAQRRKRIVDFAETRRDVRVSSASDTTYLCAADRDGNVISLIQSVFAPFGSRVVAGNTGIIMNNRLCSFGLDPSKANALKPGKRPAHTLNSYMVFRDGGFFAVGGSPGADDQPQTNVQVLHKLLDFELDPQTAVESPRWSHQPGTPPRSNLPELLRMEEGFPAEVISGLEKRGHTVERVDRWSFGSAKLIVWQGDTGTWMAAADPRREAYALGW